MSDKVTYESTLRVLPSVLKKSGLMFPLAEATAKYLEIDAGNAELVNIYARIDELPESLLDILAVDFNVTWYDYDYDVQTKRQVIKDSFYVHRYLGTIGATKKALCSVWPNTGVEEWFDYGGDPYYFRVLLEASDTTQPIYIKDIIDTIRTYQSIRSHLEDGLPVVRVTFGIEIVTDSFKKPYQVDAAGTKPRYSTHGRKSKEGLIVETDDLSVPYKPPVTGELVAGTFPRVQSHGNRDDGGLYVGADSFDSSYRARPCGTSLNSLM